MSQKCVSVLYQCVFMLLLDINECLPGGIGTRSCGQVCNNTIGSYFCSCNVGFRLLPDMFNCTGELCSQCRAGYGGGGGGGGVDDGGDHSPLIIDTAVTQTQWYFLAFHL